jgi:hypothetical protein
MKEHTLYITENHEELEHIETLLKKAKEKHQVNYQVITSEQLDERGREELLNQIRTVSLRAKIRVKSRGGGAPMPISRSSKLNMDQTPMLVVTENGRPSMVYPHERGPKGHIFTVNSYLERLLESETVEGFEQQALSEEDICRIITNFPQMLEDGLKYQSREVVVDGGVIDMVFIDREGNHMLVEIEIKATDSAIGQVNRFPIPYAEKYGIPQERIRKAIVCIEISDSTLVACRETGIEVYQFRVKKRI